MITGNISKVSSDSWLEEATKVREHPLVMVKFFERPKCKPWDLAKGRRFICCHQLKKDGHNPWCIEALRGVEIKISAINTISAKDLMEITTS